MDLAHIPEVCGVYLFKDSSFSIIYVGKAKNLRKRVSQYFYKKALESWKTANLQLLTKEIDFIPCASEREALLIERYLINKYQPFFNVLWKDSKTYPYVKITKEDFPRLLLTRKKIEDGAKYFGPYPKVETIRNIFNSLKSIKLINLRRCNFSFSLEKPLSRQKMLHCVYYHTEQCPAPCDSQRISKKEYDKLVKRAISFFNGEHQKLILDLKKQMQEYSQKLEYEKAALCRDFIKSLEHISEKVLIREMDLKELSGRFEFVDISKILKENLSLSSFPSHIEAFDVSGIFGKYTVGASVCFVNGQPNQSHWRHYKIRYKNPHSGSDDFAMMYEIVYRRLKRIKESGEKFPDLLLIDGGKGQLNMALKAAKDLSIQIDIISIAKGNEEIYSPKSKEPFVFEKDNPALNFLRRIRDEVHRFGITYHRKLREKIIEHEQKNQENSQRDEKIS